MATRADQGSAGSKTSTPPKGGLRAAQREFTRLRFIDSAVAVFAEQGYSRTTVDDIVRRAGATRATFYLHFKGKADILVELNQRVVAAFDGMYAELGEIVRSPTTEGIRTWLGRAVERWALVRDYVAPLWDGAVIEPEIRARVEKGERSQLRFLAHALIAGGGGGGGGVVGGGGGVARAQNSADTGPAGKVDTDLADAEIMAAILIMPLRHFFKLYIRNRSLDLDRMLDVLSRAWIAVIAPQSGNFQVDHKPLTASLQAR